MSKPSVVKNPGLPTASPEDDLQTLIDLALNQKAEEIVIAHDGQQVGVVTRENLLKAVRGIDVD